MKVTKITALLSNDSVRTKKNTNNNNNNNNKIIDKNNDIKTSINDNNKNKINCIKKNKNNNSTTTKVSGLVGGGSRAGEEGFCGASARVRRHVSSVVCRRFGACITIIIVVGVVVVRCRFNVEIVGDNTRVLGILGRGSGVVMASTTGRSALIVFNI